MPKYDSKDFFNVFKAGTLVRNKDGSLQETPSEPLYNGGGRRANIEEGQKRVYYSDGSDALANRGFVVTFQHVPSREYVHFKAFINSFNETFNCDWNSEAVYGRTDPIKMFRQTTRRITLSIIVPAASESEGFENLSKVQSLTSFLYPSYADTNNALTISQSPLVRLRVMNLLRKTQNKSEDFDKDRYNKNDFKTLKNGMNSLGMFSADQGLLGTINNLTVNHNIDNIDMGSFFIGDGVIIPKGIEITLDFDVIHERVLGWKTTPKADRTHEAFLPTGEFDPRILQTFSDTQFPYGIDFGGSAPLTQKMAANLKARQEQQKADNEVPLSEQQKQNAIAAGHLVASEIIDGQQQFKLTKKGERARGRIRNRRLKGTRFNPFTPRPFPEDQQDEAESYENFLDDFVQ